MLIICVVSWEMPGPCVGGFSLWLLHCWTQWENGNGFPLSCKAGSKASNNAVCCMLGFIPTQMARGCWRSCELLTCPWKLTFVAVGYLGTLRSLQKICFLLKTLKWLPVEIFLVISWTLRINNRIMCKPFHAQLSSYVLAKSFGKWAWCICLFSLCFHVIFWPILSSWKIFPFLFLHVKCICSDHRDKVLSIYDVLKFYSYLYPPIQEVKKNTLFWK